MWRITIEVLKELGDTGIDFGERNLSYLEIYGPEGRMGYFSGTWPTAEAMRSELMQNHGGGVPAAVIEKLVLTSEVVG
jgi:hypothetical protein